MPRHCKRSKVFDKTTIRCASRSLPSEVEPLYRAAAKFRKRTALDLPPVLPPAHRDGVCRRLRRTCTARRARTVRPSMTALTNMEALTAILTGTVMNKTIAAVRRTRTSTRLALLQPRRQLLPLQAMRKPIRIVGARHATLRPPKVAGKGKRSQKSSVDDRSHRSQSARRGVETIRSRCRAFFDASGPDPRIRVTETRS